MGAGKVFAGLMFPLTWVVLYYLIFPAVLEYETWKLVEKLAPGIWLLVLMICIGFIFWGLRD